MLQLIRTDSGNSDFVSLVKLLDQDLAIRNGGQHAFYSQFNKIDLIKQVVVGYLDGLPVACGAIKPFAETQAEIKRMFVHPDYRGRGLAGEILRELEHWASELGYQACVLETGKRQPEAITLYQKNGYTITENYGQYIGIDNSVCMRKDLPA